MTLGIFVEITLASSSNPCLKRLRESSLKGKRTILNTFRLPRDFLLRFAVERKFAFSRSGIRWNSMFRGRGQQSDPRYNLQLD